MERKKACSQCFLGVKNVWTPGQVPKLGLKYWKLRARKLTKLTRLKLTRILRIRVNFMER